MAKKVKTAVQTPVTQEAPKTRNPRLNSKGQGLKIRADYFPPNGSESRKEMERIAAAGEAGVPIASFKLSTMMFGHAVASGLVNVIDGNLIATPRALDILSGKLVITRNSALRTLLKAVVNAKDQTETDAIIAQIQAFKAEQLKKAS